MRHAALHRPVALLAAVGIAVMAIAAFFHHHGPLVLDVAPDRPSIVGVADEGPSACALCAGDPATFESLLVVAPAPEPAAVPLRLPEVPAEDPVSRASGTPRAPPSCAALAV